MQPISRRLFLVAGAAVIVGACSDSGGQQGAPTSALPTGDIAATTDAAATTTVAPTSPASTTTSTTLPTIQLSGDPFTLGVASGDPDPTSVVLWTRLAPEPLNAGGMPADDVDVTWEVSSTADFASIESSGTETAVAAHGHSVHAVVPLSAGKWNYRFRVGQYTSPVGTTRVAPPADSVVDRAVFAVASCQNYSEGQYAAHRDIAEHVPDFVVWLGDYIYEDAGAPGADPAARVHLGPEPTTLEEYRNRYGRYKTDPNLQAAHVTCPWFIIWDDHEVENNYAGLVPQAPADAPTFPARRFAAYQAWWEHQPVRLDPPVDAVTEYKTYRDEHWGALMNLVLLDGRQYRSDQACGDVTLSVAPPCPEVFDPTRTMLGDVQEAWLFDTLGASTATWNVIGNQVVFADATLNGAVLNFDQWDGYPVERARILQHLADAKIPNVVVVTGDIHLAAIAQLRAGDRGTGTPVGAEFITTAISSSGLISDQFTDVLKAYPHLIDAELTHRGYTLHTVTPDRWVAEYRLVADVTRADSEVTTLGSYAVDVGTNIVTKVV
ncbi:MAG TPA: alkaline phosphatase D family protein [Ilumatobacteraceae bacterium]